MRASRDLGLALCVLALAGAPAAAQYEDARPGAIAVERSELPPVEAVEAAETAPATAQSQTAPLLDEDARAAAEEAAEAASIEAAKEEAAEADAATATAPAREAGQPAMIREAEQPAVVRKADQPPVAREADQPAMAEPEAPPAAEAAAIVEVPADPLSAAIAARLTEEGDAVAIAEFYAARDYRPLWIENGAFSARADAARERIARADADGLDARAFQMPQPVSGAPAEDLAAVELQMSRAMIAYARQASGGRVSPSSISPLITVKPQRPEPASILATLATAPDVAAALDGYNPPHPGFIALRKELDRLRRAPETTASRPRIEPGPSLRPGMRDPRIADLRLRLDLAPAETDLYDGEIVAAVRAFQHERGLAADGIAGRQTIEALNGGPSGADAERLILSNMERWRWLPHELGETHIFVNVPEYRIRILRGGEIIHEARGIVGTLKNQTPIFSDEMDHIVVNPSWNVPYSIASKEMLPNLIRDPAYLARQGYEVLYTGGKKPIVINSTMIDWSQANMRHFRVRQPPGERNALGHIKFMFPNQHAVYLHDTPTRSLFTRSTRALSHGCVRVEDPFALAQVLFEGSDWNAERLGKRIGGREQRINLVRKIPIHLAYFTAWIGQDGRLATAPDIYGHDAKVERALDLGARVEAALSQR